MIFARFFHQSPALCLIPGGDKCMKSHAWEQRKIGDYLTLSKIPGHTGVDAKKLTVKLWGKGVVEKTDIYGGSQNTQYYVRRAGQFMYGKLDFLHAAFGIVPKSLDRFESTLDSPAFDLHEIDGAFLQNRVTQQNFYLKFGNIANGSRKAKRIHEVTFLDMPIVVPSYAEQKKIGAFLNKLDSLLTLHQRKWVEFFYPTYFRKFSFLNFWEFFNNRITNAWEQRKLSDIAERITRKNTHLESTLPLTISSSYGLIDQYAYFNNRVASRNTRNYYLIKNGEFAYNKSYSDGFPFGSVKRLDRYAMGVLSTLYIIFSIDYRKVNSDFLVSYYDTKNWHHQVALRAAEGARNHGLLNISADDFFETELKIPMDLDEQKKIGSFFVQLNSFITLHQRQSVSSDLLGASLHL